MEYIQNTYHLSTHHILHSLEFFTSHRVDMLVVACNTASAYALDSLSAQAPFPVIGVITPGVLATQNKLDSKDASILVIATKATIASNLYATKLQECGFHNIQSLATGLFVPFVEEGIYEGKPMQALLEHYFTGYKSPNALILGCTHFPLIAPALSAYFGKDTILIHSGEAIVEYIQNTYQLPARSALRSLKFFASDDVNALKHTAKMWLGSLYMP